jgi:pimeloyl-ACP methyl ester carboxylesterase
MPRRGRLGRLVAPICVAALLAGCTAGSPSDPAASPSGSIGAEISAEAVADVLPNDLEAETYFDMDRSAWQQLRRDAMSLPWRMVSAAGVEQAAACIGQGAPTVVYVDGFGSPAAPHWSQAAVAQSESNRVCLFDRPGMGLSPYRAEAAPHSTPEQHAQEMLAMLEVLGEPGPYLLAGWSYGGLVARTAAAQHPEMVAGLVLIDATSPLQPGLDEPLQGENGLVDTDTVVRTVGEGPDMGTRPVIVLQRGQPEKGAPADWEDTWNDLQRQAATISENSLHAVVDESDHAIPIRNPAAVVAATTAVAESLRAGNTDLPACPNDLAAAGVTCTGP